MKRACSVAASRGEISIEYAASDGLHGVHFCGWGGGGNVCEGCQERNRILGQGLTEDGEKLHRDLASDSEGREPSAWGQFKVSSPIKGGPNAKPFGYEMGVEMEGG